MGDMLKTGLEWLASKRTACMASAITYRRNSTSLDLFATVGKPDRETTDQDNVRVSAVMIDFLVTGDDFTPTFSKPRRGDEITYDGMVYEVMDFAGQGCWRWSGLPGQTMRIHAKQVG